MSSDPCGGTQLQLLPEKAPKIGPGEIASLCLVLQGAGWMQADEIALAIFHHAEDGVTEAHKRRIRAIANASDGRVLSYPGSPGYKLTKEATIAEIQNATAKLRHQAGEMHQRALEIDRVYHGKKL